MGGIPTDAVEWSFIRSTDSHLSALYICPAFYIYHDSSSMPRIHLLTLIETSLPHPTPSKSNDQQGASANSKIP